MKIKKLHLAIAAGVLVSVVLLLGLYFHRIAPIVKQNQLHTDMMFLDNVVRTYIAEYYEQNKNYPKNFKEIETAILKRCYINDVPVDSKFKDMLNTMKLSSDGAKCVSRWQIEKGNIVYRYETVFENGRSVNNNTVHKRLSAGQEEFSGPNSI
jgi:hypothetical protein